MVRRLEYPYPIQGRLNDSDYRMFRKILKKTKMSTSELTRDLIHKALVKETSAEGGSC